MGPLHTGANTKGKTGFESWRALWLSLGTGTPPSPSSTTLKVFYLHGFPLLGTWMCHVVWPHCKGRAAVRGQPPTGPNPRAGTKTGITWTNTLLTWVDRVTRAEDAPKSSLDSERAPTPNLQAAAPRKVHQQTVRVSWWALGFAFPRRHLDTEFLLAHSAFTNPRIGRIPTGIPCTDWSSTREASRSGHSRLRRRSGWCLPCGVCLRLAFWSASHCKVRPRSLSQNPSLHFVIDDDGVVDVFLGPRFVLCLSATESVLVWSRFPFLLLHHSSVECISCVQAPATIEPAVISFTMLLESRHLLRRTIAQILGNQSRRQHVLRGVVPTGSGLYDSRWDSVSSRGLHPQSDISRCFSREESSFSHKLLSRHLLRRTIAVIPRHSVRETSHAWRCLAQEKS